jgi:hypothetical protein
MTERQKALLAYVQTLGPELKKVKSVEDFIERLARCAREDAAFIGQGLSAGLIEIGRRVVEQRANDVVGIFAAKAGEFFGNMARNKK